VTGMQDKNLDPLVSYLVPVKNGEAFISKSLLSLLNQDYEKIEIVIIDDHSTDNTEIICKSFNDDRIKFFPNENGAGLVDGLNFGLTKCNGSYIARMDADDVCRFDRTSTQLKYLIANPDVGCVCSDAIRIDENDKEIGIEKGFIHLKNDLEEGMTYLSEFKPIIHPSCMFKADLIKSLGYRSFISAEDKDLWLRMLEITKIHRINENLLYYRINTSGVSHADYGNQTISSIMAVIVHEVRKKISVDIYDEFNSLYEELRRDVSLFVEKKKKNIKAFNEFKSQLKKGSLIKALIRCSLINIEDHKYFWPKLRMIENRKLVEKSTILAINIIEASKQFSKSSQAMIYGKNQ
jgi:glycosyltransferase involved in cell wall biosynthesis